MAQITSEEEFEELKEKLESYWKVGNDLWIKSCCETLDQLEGTIRSASWFGGWKANPVELVQKAIEQIQAFQESELEPYLMQLELLKLDLEALIEYSHS
jgi:hypothetical protein